MQTFDKNFKAQESAHNTYQEVFYQDGENVRIYGLGWYAENQSFARLPQSSIQTLASVNPKLNYLSKHTSGVSMHFYTTSSVLHIQSSISEFADLPQMSQLGQAGFDCYVGSSYDNLQFFDSFRPNLKEMKVDAVVSLQSNLKKLVVLYFPLYSQVTSLRLFVEKNSVVCLPVKLPNPKRIAIYGTSITQGGCASRPGLSFVNILSRKMQCEWINLGFSGNGFGEKEVAQIVACLPSIDMFILDYEANSGTNEKLEQTLEEFITILRNQHNSAKIVVVSRIPYLFDKIHPNLGSVREQIRVFQENLVYTLQRNNLDQNLFYINGSLFYDKDFHEYTVDSIHPNDLGFMKIAEGFLRELNQILID